MDDIFSLYGITLRRNQFYKMAGHWTTQIYMGHQKSQIFNKIKESNHGFFNKVSYVYNIKCVQYLKLCLVHCLLKSP